MCSPSVIARRWYRDLPGLFNLIPYKTSVLQQYGWCPYIHHPLIINICDRLYAIHPTSDDGWYGPIDCEATKRNMKSFLDLVVNHTSSEHPWFNHLLHRQESYRQYLYGRFWIRQEWTQKKEQHLIQISHAMAWMEGQQSLLWIFLERYAGPEFWLSTCCVKRFIRSASFGLIRELMDSALMQLNTFILWQAWWYTLFLEELQKNAINKAWC